MNILKALQGLSSLSGTQNGARNADVAEEKAGPAARAEKSEPRPSEEFRQQNVMVGVLERHERISNRLRASKN